MNFSAWAIRNPAPPILAFILLTITGLMAFNRLQVQNFPDMDLPTIQISAQLEGAAASQLETEVAQKIEDGLTGLDKLDAVTTTINDGSVSIAVSFQVGKNTQIALDEVKNAVDEVQQDLPPQLQKPVVSKSNLNATPLITFVVHSSRLDEAELSWLIDNDLQRTLMKVEGVGQVGRIGGIDREVHVELQADRLQELGLTANDVNARLQEVQHDASGGKAWISGANQTFRVVAAAGTVEELRAIPIPLPNGDSVRLDELGKVEDTASDRSSVAYLNGQKVIAAQVKRAKNYSDIAVTERVRQAISAFAASHPEVSIDEAYNTTAPAEQNYESSMHMLYEGAFLAVIVVFLFLRNWRATFLAALALPLSIIPTFLVMDYLGYSLNTVTLLALSLVVGVLVDDAIVEIENIDRHLLTGKDPRTAALDAADEIGTAVIATTLTLIAVFLPTAFMGGIPGIIFKQFGITASVAVFCSLLVARLITPMLAAYLMLPTDARPEHDGFMMKHYLRLVRTLLTRRWIAAVAVAAFVGGTIFMMGQLSTGFFPASDTSQTRVTVTTSPGSTLEQTDSAARAASRAAGQVEHVTSVFQATGTASTGNGPSSNATNSITSATLIVDLTPIGERDVKQSQIEAALREKLQEIPGVRIAVGTGGQGTSLQLTLSGDNAAQLDEAINRLEMQVRRIPGLGAITSSAALQSPEVVIKPHLDYAATLGVTPAAISDAVRIATSGAYDVSLAKLNLPQRQIPIRVMLEDANRKTLDRISQINVPANGGTVTLGTIADISLGSAPSEISRLDRARTATLTVELNGKNLSDVMSEVRNLDAYRNLPAGITFVEQGDLKRQSELFSSFATAMALGVFCIYGVLVLLFHDFLQPLSILMALPLALGGALLPLVVTGIGFSMPAVIGLILLMGIVTKNSILLVDYAIMARRRGMTRFDALVHACHQRARPILMTTIAMACGMAPAALSLGSGDPSFRQPMGIVVIGGLITSTLLSLVIIPVVYTFADDAKRLITRWAEKLQRTKE